MSEPNPDPTPDPKPDEGAKPLDAPGLKALQEEREARKKLERELGELRAWKAERETADLRSEIVSEKGLTPEMADALVGDTREALEAHADKLKALIPKPNRHMGRPKEALIGGASNPDDENPMEEAKRIADRIDGA